MSHRAEGLNDIFEHDVTVRGELNAKRLTGDGSGITGLAAFLNLDGSNQSSWTPSITKVTNLNADLLDDRHITTTGAGIPDMAASNSWIGRQTFFDLRSAPDQSDDLYLILKSSDSPRSGVGIGDSISPETITIVSDESIKASFSPSSNIFFGATSIAGNSTFTGYSNLMVGSLQVNGNLDTNVTADRFVRTTTGGVLTASTASTIDISSETNLAVSSPITLTGDTVGFNFSTNNTWTGTQLFNHDAEEIAITITGDSDGGVEKRHEALAVNGKVTFDTGNAATTVGNLYDFQIGNSASTYAYMIIINNKGPNYGSFFGTFNNDFELWNYQGWDESSGNYPIVFYGGYGSPKLVSIDRTGVDIRQGGVLIDGTEYIDTDGYFKPKSAADSSAPNNSIYYSTTQSKLVYKDSGGSVNVLY